MTNEWVPAEAFSPGEYLRDELDERGWTAAEFAEILGRPAQAVSEILNDRKEITPETAIAIAEALGTSAELWLNLQAAFRLHAVRQERSSVTPVTRRARLRSIVPVAELRRRGWLPNTDDIDELEASVCQFLHVATLDDSPDFAVAARRSRPRVDFSPQQIAWLARVRELAERRSVGVYDGSALETLADDLVHRIHDPYDLADLVGWLAGCGVALVIELPLRGSKIDGAALLLPNGTPTIGLTTRWNRLDSLLFTLLHEIAHIVLGHLGARGLRLDEDLLENNQLPAIERLANERARRWIFPDGVEVPNQPISAASVLAMARSRRVHPSLIVGWLQSEGQLGWDRFHSMTPKVRPFLSYAEGQGDR